MLKKVKVSVVIISLFEANRCHVLWYLLAYLLDNVVKQSLQPKGYSLIHVSCLDRFEYDPCFLY